MKICFRFKQFLFNRTVHMKISTDGVVLGGIGQEIENILDIGAGTGVIFIGIPKR